VSQPLVLICGDRDWTDREMIRAKLVTMKSLIGPFMVIHGDCRGADKIAGSEAVKLGLHVMAMPANWSLNGKNAGPIRNRLMLQYEPDLVWAFHDNLQASKGTKDMVKAAREAGVKIVHFTHPIEQPA
jgi:hypothetical protein